MVLLLLLHIPIKDSGRSFRGSGAARDYKVSGMRTMSVWKKSAGSKELRYWASAGTNYVDAGGNVNIYLGTSADTATWTRFERDIASDWSRVTGGASSWTNTDGLAVMPISAYNYDLSIDDIRLSDGRTVEFNSLTGGAIGQIASVRKVTGTGGNGSSGLTDTWLHYDHIGNVMNTSSSSGALVDTFHQDAWGNVLVSTTTGAWASTFSGRHLTTKEYDADGRMYYFWRRWYDPETGAFLSRAPRQPFEEHPYSYALSSPVSIFDPFGEQPPSQALCDIAPELCGLLCRLNPPRCDDGDTTPIVPPLRPPDTPGPGPTPGPTPLPTPTPFPPRRPIPTPGTQPGDDETGPGLRLSGCDGLGGLV